MKPCKWCGEVTYHSDECGICWGFIHGLNHALHVKKLFTIMKRLVIARIKEIHEDGHF